MIKRGDAIPSLRRASWRLRRLPQWQCQQREPLPTDCAVACVLRAERGDSPLMMHGRIK